MKFRFAFLALAALALAPGSAEAQQQREITKIAAGTTEPVQLSQKELQKLAPALGYLEAHKNVQNPFPILGGPIRTRVSQKSGGVHVALPAHRRVDERVFGIPALPRAYGGSPLVTGLPPEMRGTEGDAYSTVKELSPFGDKSIVLPEGKLTLEALDATATDAAVTSDSVKFEASWKDKEGNTYTVRCDKVVPHGVEYPVFGGVVTNHILHGVSSVGTPLMPTEYTYVAFWGMGEVLKNGEVLDKPRVVHGMLTEYVRGEDYKLVFDHEVTPTRRHFHVMVAPVTPMEGHFVKKPVKTGFQLPNGQELPFWHVMFANLEIEAERTEGKIVATETGDGENKE